jgi:hypothetical protein
MNTGRGRYFSSKKRKNRKRIAKFVGIKKPGLAGLFCLILNIIFIGLFFLQSGQPEYL